MKLYSKRQILFLAAVFGIVTGIGCFFAGMYSGKQGVRCEDTKNTAAADSVLPENAAAADEEAVYTPLLKTASETGYRQPEAQNSFVYNRGDGWQLVFGTRSD